MGRVLVVGLVNIETTLRVPGFPIDYFPVTYPFFGVRSAVSGTGWNVAKALATLGHEVRLASLVGTDRAGRWAREEIVAAGVDDAAVIDALTATPASVVLVDPSGRRQVHTDLKDVQEPGTVFPLDRIDAALDGCDLMVAGNLNLTRPLLGRARAAGVPVVTDVHVLADLDDAYNRDFMAAARLLFLSDEGLGGRDPATVLGDLRARYGPDVVVLGRGGAGAMLLGPGGLAQAAAVAPRGVVNTVGAGDALLAGYVHGHLAGADPGTALAGAVAFAGWKVGEDGAADGFLDAAGLAGLVARGGLRDVEGGARRGHRHGYPGPG